MASRHALLFMLALAPFATTGCIFFGGDGGSANDTTSGGNTIAQDIAQYDTLQFKLEKSRTVFKKSGASELNGIGTRLFWLEFPTDSPTLRSFDTSTSQAVAYTFPIGG